MAAFFLFKDQNCHFSTIQNTIPNTKYLENTDHEVTIGKDLFPL